MEWIFKLPQWLQIPLKILLPFLTVFSGFILIARETVLDKLYLLEFRNNNGFVFGLLFLIAVSLESIYFLAFLYYKFIKPIFIRRGRIKIINGLSDDEKDLVIELYKQESCTAMLDFQKPITQMLLNKGFITMGSTQIITTNPYTNQTPINVRLETWVIKIFDYLYGKLVHLKKKLYQQIKKCQKESKRTKIQEKLNEVNDYLERFGGNV